MQSDGKKSLWDFLPLPKDPTPEERAKLLKEATQEQSIRDDDYARAVLADFKQRGFI